MIFDNAGKSDLNHYVFACGYLIQICFGNLCYNIGKRMLLHLDEMLPYALF